MKRFTSSLAMALALVVVLLGNGSASAHVNAPTHPSMPASYNCTSGCTSLEQWNGTTYGGKTYFYNDSPGFFTNYAYWMRFLRFDNATNAAHVDVGVVKNTNPANNNSYCKGTGSTNLQDFVYVWNADLTLRDHFCADVLSRDINTQQNHYAKVSDFCYSYFNEQDGISDEWEIDGNCYDTEQTSYGRMNLYETVNDAVSGHQVWGGKWNNNAYVSNTLQYVYQHVNPTFSSVHNPPQMYWNITPPNSTTGGELWSCVYDSGTSCSFRS